MHTVVYLRKSDARNVCRSKGLNFMHFSGVKKVPRVLKLDCNLLAKENKSLFTFYRMFQPQNLED